MKTPQYAQLTEEQIEQIKQALTEVLTDGPEVTIDENHAISWSGQLAVSVHPAEYPDEMFAFTQSLAAAEIRLRDAGLPVRLIPAVQQRMVVVATPNGQPQQAYLTTDG